MSDADTIPCQLRWYSLTSERFVGALIAVEICLWLSEHFRWFAFDEKKGLPFLVALVGLAVSLLGFAVRFLFALVFRRRFQFGIRTLLLLTLAAAIPFSWLAASVEKAKKTDRLVERLRNEREFHIETKTWLTPPDWLSKLLGGEFFSRATFLCHPVSDLTDEDFALCCQLDDLETCIVSQSAVTDAGLEHIINLKRLKTLDLRDTPITDAGLKHLAKLSRLETLNLTGTNVTEAGVQRLQSQLPRCKVTW